jgi:hypothetical protein
MGTTTEAGGFGAFFGGQTGTSPKVDGAISYALFLWVKQSGENYKNEQERRFKYLALRDLLCVGLAPYLVPKIVDENTARYYFEKMDAVKDPKVIYNLDKFFNALQELAYLFAQIVANNGYYEIKGVNDKEYEKLLKSGVELVYD